MDEKKIEKKLDIIMGMLEDIRRRLKKIEKHLKETGLKTEGEFELRPYGG